MIKLLTTSILLTFFLSGLKAQEEVKYDIDQIFALKNADELIKLYNKENIKKVVSDGEGGKVTYYIIYPNTGNEITITTDNRNPNQIESIRIEKNTVKWINPHKIKTGMSLSELVALNYKPIMLSYLCAEGEESFTITGWNNGFLKDINSNIFLKSLYKGNGGDCPCQAFLTGETNISSLDDRTPTLKLFIAGIYFYKANYRPKQSANNNDNEKVLLPRSDTISLNNLNYFFLQSKYQNTDFKNCSEEVITNFIENFKDKVMNGSLNNFSSKDEFQKRRIIEAIRDSLNKYQKEVSTQNIYTYSNVRLLSKYDFDDSSYLIMGRLGDPLFSNEMQGIKANEIYHKTIFEDMYLSNSNSFPLKIKLMPDSAERMLKIKKKGKSNQELVMETRTIYSDWLGNSITGDDKRIFLKYFIKFTGDEYQETKEKSRNITPAKILRIDFYIDKDLQHKVYSETALSQTPIENSEALVHNDQSNRRDSVNRKQYSPSEMEKLISIDDYNNADNILPTFPGGKSAMNKWISQHIRYPDEAINNGIQGEVHLLLMVSDSGIISDVTVVSSPNQILTQEATRVVRAMPSFWPAKKDGKSISGKIEVPFIWK